MLRSTFARRFTGSEHVQVLENCGLYSSTTTLPVHLGHLHSGTTYYLIASHGTLITWSPFRIKCIGVVSVTALLLSLFCYMIEGRHTIFRYKKPTTWCQARTSDADLGKWSAKDNNHGEG
jgi:hypothetical protein